MIHIHTPGEQTNLRASGKLLGDILRQLVAFTKPGVTLLQIEQLAQRLIQKEKAKPAFLGYHGYKNILCTSVNEEVVHCPPTGRVLLDGDILSIDAGVIVHGMYSDAAVTIPVGKISATAQKLIDVTRTSLYEIGVAQIKPGNKIGDIGHAIQTYVEQHGFSVVKQLVGHGIGRHLHEDPAIPNYGEAHIGAILKPGMAIAVEPMVNVGKEDVIFEDDGWRVVTTDGTLSAHFEHTFLVTDTGCEVLTKF
ncbi:MAG: type I methionyl aminopeptidase [Patescibacteria group bacterium]|jgi:methionyl aminopeptidase